MTNKFDALCESIISEVLSGSNKRNKVPGMGRKNGPQRDINHIIPMARNIQKHAAHIRPVGKVIGNETGVHSKDPTSKPVYAKNGIKPFQNSSQRDLKGGSGPYSVDHAKFGTKRKLKSRRERLLRSKN